MTVLDQALIKAYQRRSAGGPHARFADHNGGAERMRSAECGVRSAELLLDASAAASVSLVAGTAVNEREAAASVAPAAGAGTAEHEPKLSGTRPGATLPDCDPISARPALEIERFDWPPLVEALREAAADEWPSLVEELLSGSKSLLVTGCRRGEGRTSVALFVAAGLAADGRRVGLIDADIAQPQLAARLGVLPSTDWREALSQQLAVAEATIESLTDRVVLLPLREFKTESSLPIDAVMLRTAIAALRAHCDLVCIDAGPVADDTDQAYGALLAAGIDAALVVRDVRHSRLQQSHAVGRRLAQAGIGRWAIIENFTRDAHV